MTTEDSDKKTCGKYSKNSRCTPKCGAPGGKCNEVHTEYWCILKPGEE